MIASTGRAGKPCRYVMDQSIEPVYETTDGAPGLTFVMLLLTIFMFGFAIFMPQDPKVAAWFMWFTRGLFVFFGILTSVVLPRVRLRVFPDHTEIRYGLVRLIGFRLDNSKITKVEAVTYSPLRDFGGWGIKGGQGRWKGYTAFTASLTNTALAIQTTEKNYLVGCPNPEEAEMMIRNLLGAKKPPLQPPPTGSPGL